ncbi:hypothetical protein SLE2022_269260 [Rubroshorea leprosula]
MARKNEANDAVIQVEDQGAVSSPGVDVQEGRSSPPQQPDEENSQPAEKGTAKDDDTSPYDGEKQRGKWGTCSTFSIIVQSFLFACSIGFLVTSLKVDVLKNSVIGGLKLWKWCALASVIFCGRHLMRLIMKAVISLIKRRFAFIKGKTYYSYFIYGLGRSIGVFLWLCSVFVTWYLLFHISEVEGSKSYLLLHGYQIRHYVSMSLATLPIGGLLWVVKTLLVNILSSSLKFGRFFDRVQQSIIDLYILEVLSAYVQKSSASSGPSDLVNGNDTLHGLGRILQFVCPSRCTSGEKSANAIADFGALGVEGRSEASKSTSSSSLVKIKSSMKRTKSVTRWVNSRYGDQQLKDEHAINLLKKMNPEKASAWTMEEFVKMIRRWDSLDDIKILHKIADEKRALNSRTGRTAKLIYDRVRCSDNKYISKDDLIEKVKFQEKEVIHVIQRINGESGGEVITESALEDWLVNAEAERNLLRRSLDDSERAIRELNKLVSGTVLILIITIWLLLTGILTTQGLIVILSQFFLLAFMFGNSAKSVYEGIIFVFVTHPFDIEDHCLINGEEMVVESITLLTTVFCKNGKDKIFYPNSVLTTLPIKNFYRGVIDIDYSVEFVIDNSITKQQIEKLESQMKEFLENDRKSWLPGIRIVRKEIEDGKMKMVLCVSCCNINLKGYEHTMSERRSELVDKLKNVFAEDIEIKYYGIRPQEVDLLHSSSRRPLEESRSFLFPH